MQNTDESLVGNRKSINCHSWRKGKKFTFKKWKIDKNLAVTSTAAIANLQKDLELEFSEVADLLWKLALLKKRYKGVASHLENCSICSSNKPAVLLLEYGMAQAEWKEVAGKMKNWKGYYFATVDAISVALELNVAREIRSKLTTTCWVRVQNVHEWHQTCKVLRYLCNPK